MAPVTLSGEREGKRKTPSKIQVAKSLNLGRVSRAAMEFPYKNLSIKNTRRSSLRIRFVSSEAFEYSPVRPLFTRFQGGSSVSMLIPAGATEVLRLRLFWDPMDLPTVGPTRRC